MKARMIPYGYKMEKGIIGINGEEAKQIRRIFEMRLNGTGVYAIGKRLYEQQIPFFTDTRDKAIKKAAGEDGEHRYERATYEGYGPAGTAIIVEALTDNKNRTASNVRHAFTKGSGNIGTQGCVSFMFDQKGQIIVDKEEYDGDADTLMMDALDCGAEDFNEEDDSYEILTDPNDFSEVRLELEKKGIPMAAAEVTMIPQTEVKLTDPDDIKNLVKTLDILEEDDDVQDVYHNADFEE